jgi:hypothetical protein
MTFQIRDNYTGARCGRIGAAAGRGGGWDGGG